MSHLLISKENNFATVRIYGMDTVLHNKTWVKQE